MVTTRGRFDYIGVTGQDEHREEAPQRKAVEKAVRDAKKQLLETRPKAAVTADLVRQVEARIIALDSSHAAYVSALERRAKARKDSARVEREHAITKSKQDSDEMMANPEATPDEKMLQQQVHATEINRYDVQAKLMAVVARGDDEIRAMGDQFVIIALHEAASEDGGRTLLRRLSDAADVAIDVGGVIPPTAPFAAIAALVKKALDLAAKKLDRGPPPAPDERYEAASEWLQVATQLMDAWAVAVTRNSPELALR